MMELVSDKVAHSGKYQALTVHDFPMGWGLQAWGLQKKVVELANEINFTERLYVYDEKAQKLLDEISKSLECGSTVTVEDEKAYFIQFNSNVLVSVDTDNFEGRKVVSVNDLYVKKTTVTENEVKETVKWLKSLQERFLGSLRREEQKQ